MDERKGVERNKKPLKNKVKGFINCYLKTLKSHSSKNTLSALKRKEDKRNYEIIKYKNDYYKVIVKSYYNLYLNVYSYLYPNKLPLLNDKLTTEFNKRLTNSNKLLFDTSYTKYKPLKPIMP